MTRTMDELVSDFICEAAEALGGLQAGLARLAVARNDPSAAGQMLRRLHGLKGVCGFVGFSRAEALCHAGESLLGAMNGTSAPPAALAPLSDMIQRLGELLSAAAELREEPQGEDRALIARLEACAARLNVLGVGEPNAHRRPTLFEPPAAERRTRDPWAGLDTLARALGDRLGKRIELMTAGDEPRICARAAGPLRSALIALVRNACDHGIEAPAQRLRAGKPALSILRLTVMRRGDGATIELADDGRGVDPDIQALVFEPGFSTAPELTHLSGRGMGLDLVRRELERLGGTADLDSVPGAGCRVILTLPATALAAAPEADSAGRSAA